MTERERQKRTERKWYQSVHKAKSPIQVRRHSPPVASLCSSLKGLTGTSEIMVIATDRAGSLRWLGHGDSTASHWITDQLRRPKCNRTGSEEVVPGTFLPPTMLVPSAVFLKQRPRHDLLLLSASCPCSKGLAAGISRHWLDTLSPGWWHQRGVTLRVSMCFRQPLKSCRRPSSFQRATLFVYAFRLSRSAS